MLRRSGGREAGVAASAARGTKWGLGLCPREKLKKSTFVQFSLIATIVLVAAALVMRVINAPPGTKIFGGDTLVLMSPLFFGMAAKRGGLGPAAVLLSALGLAFASLALWAALQGKKKKKGRVSAPAIAAECARSSV